MSTTSAATPAPIDAPEDEQITLDQLTTNLLYNFLDQANPIGGIAKTHGESIERVLNACTSPLARKFLRSVARAEKLRSCVLALRARGRALHGLTAIVESDDDSPAGRETRRRAADSILRATAPQRHSAKPTTPQSTPPEKPDRAKRTEDPIPRTPISPKDWPEHMRQVQLKVEQDRLRRQQLQQQEVEQTQTRQSSTPAPHLSSLTQTPISNLQSAAGAPTHRPTPSSSTLRTVQSEPSQHPTSEIPHPTSPPPNSYPSA